LIDLRESVTLVIDERTWKVAANGTLRSPPFGVVPLEQERGSSPRSAVRSLRDESDQARLSERLVKNGLLLGRERGRASDRTRPLRRSLLGATALLVRAVPASIPTEDAIAARRRRDLAATMATTADVECRAHLSRAYRVTASRSTGANPHGYAGYPSPPKSARLFSAGRCALFCRSSSKGSTPHTSSRHPVAGRPCSSRSCGPRGSAWTSVSRRPRRRRSPRRAS
jgi:hypothetical protein